MRFIFYKFTFFILIALVSLPKKSSAFTDKYLVTYFSVNEGLSHNIVSSMLIDTVGFMWIATENGLNRFDGNTFKVYKNTDEQSIINNSINKLFLDSKGRIWLGANEGYLMKYEYDSDTFTDIDIQKAHLNNSNITDIIEDANGTIWVATLGSGVFAINDSLKVKLNINSTNYKLKTDQILSIHIDQFGYLWLGTEGEGLYCYNPFVDSLIEVKLETNSASYKKIAILDIESDGQSLYLGTYGKGVLEYNIEHKTIKEYSSETGFIVRYVKDIQLTGDYMYVGTRSDGLVRINMKNHSKPDQLTLQTENELTLNNSSVISIFSDKDGNIWMGTEGGGLNVVTKRSFTFTEFESPLPTDINVSVVFRDKNDAYWIGTYGNGTYHLNKEYQLLDHFLAKDENSICGNTIRSIAQDTKGNIWFGSDSDGLSRYNPFTKSFTSYRKSTDNKGGLSNNAIHSILAANENIVWFGTWGGGLCWFDYRTGLFRTVTVDKDLAKNVVIHIYKSDENTLWLATRGNGLVRYSIAENQLKYFKHSAVDKKSISNNYVTRIAGNGDGVLWLATAGGGLNRFSIEDETFEVFSERNGLVNDVIPCLCDDGSGNIWLATINGLSVFLKQSKRFYNFNLSDGIKNLSYNQSACFKDQENVIYMPGNKGIDCVRSSNFNKKEEYLRPIITSVAIDNITTEYKAQKQQQLNRNSVIADTLILKPDQKTISLHVTALSLLGKNTTFFRYKLKSEKEWTYKSGTVIKINYNSLEIGENNLLIEAGTTGNTYDGKKGLVIVVRPPFYKRGWFWIIIGFLLVFIVFMAIRLQNKLLKTKNQELENSVQERTAEIQRQKNELEKQSKKILEQQEQILSTNKLLEKQNNELDTHRQDLEKLVDERTKELLAALEKAKESDKLKTSFLTNISHEIRTPLNSIIGFSDLLTKFDEFTADKRNVFISAIQRNGDTLIRLIDDIIELAKFESQQIDIKYKLFNVEPMMQKMYDVLCRKIDAENKKIVVKLEVSRLFKQLSLYSDEFRIEQVLINLIDNAVKYTEKGEIAIGFEVIDSDHEESFVQFFVKDTGVGIDQANLHKIFERFHKVAISNMKLYRGTGLGLALSKYVTEAMGGKIWVESEQNVGSKFMFSVPIKSCSQCEEDDLNLSGKIVLIAEDEDYNYDLIRESLAFTNAEFYNAPDGIEAVRLAKELKPDLILMDIRMPRSDGYQATAEIRQFNKTVPIIAQTAYAMSSELNMMLSNGFTSVVTKPLDFVRLLKEIKKCLPLQ